MKSLKTYIKEEKAPTNVGIYRALQATGEVGPHSANSAPRVSNPNNLKDSDFIKLIQDTFPPPSGEGVTDVVKYDPETSPNDSRTWPMFVFSWNGKVDNRVWLTG